MARKKDELPLDDIYDALDIAINRGLKEIAERLEIAYGQCIDRFYKDYPFTQSYERTYSLYAGSNGWGWRENGVWSEKNIRKISKNKYYVGIKVGFQNIQENIGENPYEDKLSYVFGRSYLKGIHGMTPEGAAKLGLKWHKNPMSPPPIHFMEKDYHKIANNHYLDDLFGRLIVQELARKTK